MSTHSLQHCLTCLREHLHATPSPNAWNAITDLFDGWPAYDQEGLKVALDYAENHLEQWDDRLRVAPTRWTDFIFKGALPPQTWRLIRCLCLTDRALNNQGARYLAQYRHMRHIRWLRLNASTITDPGVVALSRSLYLEQLVGLELNASGVTREGVESLLSSRHLTSLKHIHINATTVSFAFVLIFKNRYPNITLYTSSSEEEEVDFSLKNLTPDVLEGLIVANTLSKQRTLVLDRNPLGEQGMQVLTMHASKLPCLKDLRLNGCDIDDQALATLIGSPLLSQLEKLTLGWNGFGEEGLKALANVTTLEGLSLDLSYSRLSDASLNVLLECPMLGTLNTLRLYGENLTSSQIRRFEAVLPNRFYGKHDACRY